MTILLFKLILIFLFLSYLILIFDSAFNSIQNGKDYMEMNKLCKDSSISQGGLTWELCLLIIGSYDKNVFVIVQRIKEQN